MTESQVPEPSSSQARNTDAAKATECEMALSRLHEFLHQELEVSQADLIRAHLDACEKCLDEFDVESAISSLVRRCYPPVQASTHLRMRVVQVSMTLQTRTEGLATES